MQQLITSASPGNIFGTTGTYDTRILHPTISTKWLFTEEQKVTLKRW